jgi:hypothetical protein
MKRPAQRFINVAPGLQQRLGPSEVKRSLGSSDIVDIG